jgi:SAM-dependent methyltransferase
MPIQRLKRFAQQQIERTGYSLAKRPAPRDELYDGFAPESLRERRFYNVGAGRFRHRYWTRIDYGTEYYAEVQQGGFIDFDLMAGKPLPIADGGAEVVYSSHTIEHVDDTAVANLLREAHRVLRPGGFLRLTTPDAELAHRAYRARDRGFFYWTAKYSKPGTWEELYRMPLTEASVPGLFLHSFASQLSEVDSDTSAKRKYSDVEIDEAFASQPLPAAFDFFSRQCVFNPKRPGAHINWWTYDKVTAQLRAAGFSDIYRSGYGQSGCPPLRDTLLFDSTHPAISLYVEARKA